MKNSFEHYAKKEEIAADALAAHIGATTTYNTQEGARTDAVFSAGGVLLGVAEIKTRSDNYPLSKIEQYGTALVVGHKLKEGKVLAKALGCPFFIAMFFPEDETMLVWEVFSETGKLQFEFDFKKTRTQKSIRGGHALRVNAFLPVSAAARVTVAQ